MIITQIEPQVNHKLRISTKDGRTGLFDVLPYLNSEAFVDLQDNDNFIKIRNGKYFIEWDCGSDLSADTIESEWKVI
ncbi:conserved hypothetical protein [Abyssogena phaseoliformis symbiont OG214]|uniref:DUF2442 domain-containing protein n=1 Tax=Abyssogena phaseoliformis symbiont TaxID=596095 RepID=UPI001916B678|nr:DUF2442 domain-containing protein [Abyssogena phaseoliformis symbiont]BBB23184.1 conserved hypothetical protein [Abyssogena phaseoliformis symbiont OG214]